MARPLKEDAQLIDGKFYVSQKLACQLCDVAVQTLRGWRDRENPPPYNSEYDMFPVKELGQWIRTEQLYKRGRGNKFPYKPDLTRFDDYKPTTVNMMPGLEPKVKESHSDRYDRLKADKMEMELNEKAGTFVLADEVLLAMSSMVSNVKTRLLAIPSQVANTLSLMNDPVKVQTFMEEELHIALEGLTPDWEREIDFDANDDEDEE